MIPKVFPICGNVLGSSWLEIQRKRFPPNCPESLGKEFIMRAFVDSDHAGDLTTRRSRTCFLVCLNSALIYWLSKKQTSIETSSFGSEFIAMKQCCEYIRGLRYKLRMMGVPSRTQHLFLETINQSYGTRVSQNRLWRRRAIQLHIIMWEKVQQRMNGGRHTFQLGIIRRTCWPRLCVQVWIEGGRLDSYCMIYILRVTKRG